mgnify:CR=1 FL=1
MNLSDSSNIENISPNKSWVTISLLSEASALPGTTLSSTIPYFTVEMFVCKVVQQKAQVKSWA